MKGLVIGLRPEYTYPGKLEKWQQSNTLYASNFGASLIPTAILRQFDCDYVDDFSDIKALKRTYDFCILALSTHIHQKRDVSLFADVVEKLDLPTFAPSLGIQDYVERNYDVKDLHPSVIRLLKAVSRRSQWIGARGHYTASVLYRCGIENVLPVGCPTVFYGLDDSLAISKKVDIENTLVVYHRVLAAECPGVLAANRFMGQDFEDEAVFTENLKDDKALNKQVLSFYNKLKSFDGVKAAIRENGLFPSGFADWFKMIGQQDFVFGPRIHGCIAALIQGIPAAICPRDIRTKELAEFFMIPQLSFDDLRSKSVEELYRGLDFELFNRTYKDRYKNYVSFLNENGLQHNLDQAGKSFSYEYTSRDLQKSIYLANVGVR